MTAPIFIVDVIDGNTALSDPVFVFGLLDIDVEADLLTVRACGLAVSTQIAGARGHQLAKLILRSIWTEHLRARVLYAGL